MTGLAYNRTFSLRSIRKLGKRKAFLSVAIPGLGMLGILYCGPTRERH